MSLGRVVGAPAYAAPVPTTGARARVVVLDDDVVMLGALDRLLSRAGYAVVATHDPRRALEAVVSEGADAVVSDLYMPDMGGNVVLAMIAKAAPRTARLLLTSECDFQAVAALSVPFSVDAFLPKREVSAGLVPTLRLLLGERHRDEDAGPPDRARTLARSIACSLASPAEFDRCDRVAAWAVRLGSAIGLSPAQLLDLEIGALLHDIGEVGLPPGLLAVPRTFTEGERLEVRRHPDVGASMLTNLTMLRRAIPIVQTHHERFDGTGYPRGLRGNAIPLESRVFQIVDAYDAITMDRPHRRGRTDGEAREELRRHAASQFDPEIHDAFARIDPEEWTSVVDRVRAG